MAEKMAFVVVMRVTDGPSHIPADITNCQSCGCECWISKETGQANMQAARDSGYPVKVLCQQCLRLRMLFSPDNDNEVHVLPEVLEEARQYGVKDPEKVARELERFFNWKGN